MTFWIPEGFFNKSTKNPLLFRANKFALYMLMSKIVAIDQMSNIFHFLNMFKVLHKKMLGTNGGRRLKSM